MLWYIPVKVCDLWLDVEVIDGSEVVRIPWYDGQLTVRHGVKPAKSIPTLCSLVFEKEKAIYK